LGEDWKKTNAKKLISDNLEQLGAEKIVYKKDKVPKVVKKGDVGASWGSDERIRGLTSTALIKSFIVRLRKEVGGHLNCSEKGKRGGPKNEKYPHTGGLRRLFPVEKKVCKEGEKRSDLGRGGQSLKSF